MESLENGDEEAPLVVGDSRSQTPSSYWRDVHIVSFAFLFVFLAYGAAQNLETTVNAVSLISCDIEDWNYQNFHNCSAVPVIMVFELIFNPGRWSWDDIAWNIVCIFHVFLLVCIFGGSISGLKECAYSWDHWVLVFRSCKLDTIMVISDPC